MIPGLGRSPGEGKGYPLQYSGLENSMDCIVYGVAKSWTRLSDFHFHTQGWDAVSVGSYSGIGGDDFLRGSQPSHTSTLGCIGVGLCCCCLCCCTGKEPIPHSETIAIMAIREACVNAKKTPLEWVSVG